MTDPAALIEQGKTHHRAGRLDEAQLCYRKALAMAPENADALHMSAVLTFHRGRAAAAVPLLEKAVAAEPGNAQYLGNLGAIRLAAGQVAGAVEALEAALQIDDSAIDLLSNYGAALREAGRIAESCAVLEKARSRAPDDPGLMVSLGVSCLQNDDIEAALAAADAALAINGRDGEALNLKGAALMAADRREDALDALQKSVECAPDLADAARNLGNCLQSLRRYSEAEDQYRAAVTRWPDDAAAHAGLARTLRLSGQSRAAIDAYRAALTLAPDNMRYHSRFLFTLLCDDRVSPEELTAEHITWGQRHTPDPIDPGAFGNDRDPERRLRIGYVSADFRNHPVGRIFLPVLRQHDREQVEIWCYDNGDRCDSITEEIQDHTDHWQEITALDDAAVQARIRDDQIDILVDLGGHTAGHRLRVFGARAAPVQLSWLGYMSTSGVPAMDAIIGDDVHTPAGSDQEFCETVIRLDRDLACFESPAEAPPVSDSPIGANGTITFGAFCNPGKISPSTIALWARVMAAIPDARLHLRYDGFQDAALQARFRAAFTEHGIDADRLAFVGSVADYADVLAAYHDIDVAFDTHPYSGTMTSFEALWMGVPVLALAGDRMVARQAPAHLIAAGLEEMVAADADSYVSIAGTLAADPARLAEMRVGMRDRLLASPVCDAAGLARSLETSLRSLWRDFCRAAEQV